MKLADTAAVITGGASGLGEATARYFAEAGAQVTILDRDASRGAPDNHRDECWLSPEAGTVRLEIHRDADVVNKTRNHTRVNYSFREFGNFVALCVGMVDFNDVQCQCRTSDEHTISHTRDCDKPRR